MLWINVCEGEIEEQTVRGAMLASLRLMAKTDQVDELGSWRRGWLEA